MNQYHNVNTHQEPAQISLPNFTEERIFELQINLHNGLSMDYWNEFCALLLAFEIGLSKSRDSNTRAGTQYVLEQLREHPVRLYRDRYSGEKYTDLFCESTLPLIQKLDAIVEELRAKVSSSSLSVHDLAAAFEGASKILHGELRMFTWPEEYG